MPSQITDRSGTRRTYVGERVARVEDTTFLTGRGNYIDDIELRGMLHAAFLRSPFAHARIRSIDTSAAEALEGVHAVVTGEDLRDRANPFVVSMNRPEVQTGTQRVLPLDRVRHVGEAVAVVVADSRYIAEDACELIEVDFEPLPALVEPEDALKPDAPLIHDDIAGNNFGHIEGAHGDVEAAFAAADRVFSRRFHTGRAMGGPLEARGAIADYHPDTGDVDLYSSTQIPHFVRTMLAEPTGFPENKLRVIAPDVGGGFGPKSHVFVEEAILTVVSKMIGRPIKWIEDRYEHLAACSHSKEVVIYLEIAVTNDGKFLAFRGHYIGNAGAYPAYPWTSMIDPLAAATLLPSLYDIDAVGYTVDSAFTNKCPAGAYRGIGWTAGHIARESLIDEVARELDIDPAELRLRNIIPSTPFVSKTGMKYDGGSYAESIEKAMELIDYQGLREKQAELRKEGRYIGIGLSPFIEPTAWGSEIANVSGFPAPFFDSSSVRIDPDGSVVVTTGLHSHGQGHATSLAQLTADELGVRVEDVKIEFGDTASAAYGMGTFASRSAVIGGGTIIRAASEVRKKLRAIAAHAMEVSPDDLEFHEGKVSVKGIPSKSMTIAETAGLGYFGGAARPADLEPTLTATRHYDPPETYSNGMIVAIVEVDPETGHVELEKIVAIEDCGTMLNPMLVEGQVAGAVAQGIGIALYEEVAYDETGQLLSGTLMDYLYPSTTEVPPMDVGHLVTPSSVTEGGIKGVGEGGMVSAPAAVVNAVSDALAPWAVNVQKTPLGPEYVRALVRAATAESLDAGATA